MRGRSSLRYDRAMRAIDESARCPCGTGLPYGECCAPRHRGATAPTAETLMRSRYTAFALELASR